MSELETKQVYWSGVDIFLDQDYEASEAKVNLARQDIFFCYHIVEFTTLAREGCRKELSRPGT